MKDKLKGLILGVTIGSLITGATAFAAGGKMIEVFYSVKDIKINNISKMPTGDDKPFVYNGKTYVPLGYISSELKEPVKWDGSSKVIYIGETGDANALYLDKDIKHMNYQTGYSSNKTIYSYNADGYTVKDNIGTEYSNYLTMYTVSDSNYEKYSWQYVEFPLNGTVKSFNTKLGSTNKYLSTTANVKITISADDKVVYTHEFKPGDFPEDGSVNSFV
ncbi:hypothetical protein J2T13_004580 [Paenibacillus sp. DS2015]|uniref:stalk domain-containing protein n=1 Tax=Paenibacillus sp. DS2015 TaxID=3373917 RepID=UPI003D1ADA53